MSLHMAHCFHMVNPSPWPLVASLGAGLLITGVVVLIRFGDTLIFIIGLAVRIITAGQWWRDIRREASYQGLHTISVQ